MSIEPINAVAHVDARNHGLRRFAEYLLFAFCAGIYLLPYMRIVLNGSNEGTLVDGAVRIMQGQVFARDFFEVMGPGTFYWLAAFFKLFGITFLATRICLFVTSLGTALLLYFLTRRICPSYYSLPCIILVGTSFAMQWPGISHHVDSNFFALLAVACVVLWLDSRRRTLLFLVGIFAGFTTCILQPKGFLLLCAILLWFWLRRKTQPVALSALGFLLAGYLVVFAVTVIYFWSQSALGSLIYANFVWPSQSYGAVNKVPYALGIFDQYWKHWFVNKSGFKWTIAMASALTVPFVFVAALPALLPLLGLRYKWKSASPELILFLLCGCAMWISEIHRKDIYHLVFGSPLLIVICIHFLGNSTKKAADLSLQLLSIFAGLLLAFNLLQVVLAHSIPTRVGTIALFKNDPVLDFLNANTKPGEDIFIYPFAPMYYFLSATSNPTRFSILEYNYNRSSEFRQVIQVLEQRKVHYVLWDTNFESKLAPVVYPECPPMPPSSYLIEPYLQSHYTMVKDVDGLYIMERKKDDHAN